MTTKKQSPKALQPLTPRQLELWEYIQSFWSKEQRIPSYREMASALGLNAVGSIQDLVKALCQKGYLKNEGRKLKSTQAFASPETVSIPILGDVAAGPFTDSYPLDSGRLSLDASALGISRKNRQLKARSLIALKVSGESMIDAGILPGDFVIVDTQAQIKNGDTIVVSLLGESTLKEVELSKGKIARLIPRNKAMKAFKVEESADLRITGKVLALQRRL